MKDAELLERIALNPAVMAGKPVIRETRLTVAQWLREQGRTGVSR